MPSNLSLISMKLPSITSRTDTQTKRWRGAGGLTFAFGRANQFDRERIGLRMKAGAFGPIPRTGSSVFRSRGGLFCLGAGFLGAAVSPVLGAAVGAAFGAALDFLAAAGRFLATFLGPLPGPLPGRREPLRPGLVGASLMLADSMPSTSICSISLPMNLITASRKTESLGVAIICARPARPARPVRPMRWT